MLPSEHKSSEQNTISSLLKTLIASSGLLLSFSFVGDLNAGGPEASASESQSGSKTSPLQVEFTGPDTPLLTARNGELLHAFEHIAAKALRLEEEDHDRVSFDADSYKANRDLALRQSAERAIASVRTTGEPYAFAPMNSRERRLLHLALKESGLPTASSGEMPRRFVVLYPEGYDASASARSERVAVPDRERAIRNSFRRR